MRYYEDFQMGEHIISRGRTITEADIVMFAARNDGSAGHNRGRCELLEPVDPLVVGTDRLLPLGGIDVIGLGKPPIKGHLWEQDKVTLCITNVRDQAFPGFGKRVGLVRHFTDGQSHLEILLS